MEQRDPREALAVHLDRIRAEMGAMLETWERLELPGDVLGTGYPFHLSLDEMVAEVEGAVEAIRFGEGE